MGRKPGQGVKKMSRAERLCLLYDQVATLLQETVDPLRPPGYVRTRPFAGSTANKVDSLWEGIQEEETGSPEMLGAYKELVRIYELYGSHSWRTRITDRVKERISPLMDQIKQLEEVT